MAIIDPHIIQDLECITIHHLLIIRPFRIDLERLLQMPLLMMEAVGV